MQKVMEQLAKLHVWSPALHHRCIYIAVHALPAGKFQVCMWKVCVWQVSVLHHALHRCFLQLEMTEDAESPTMADAGSVDFAGATWFTGTGNWTHLLFQDTGLNWALYTKCFNCLVDHRLNTFHTALPSPRLNQPSQMGTSQVPASLTTKNLYNCW